MSTHVQGELFEYQAKPAVDAASPMALKKLSAVCLFSSAGIGELGVERVGINIQLANEILPLRAACYRHNFKHSEMLEGDINEVKDDFIARAKQLLQDDELFLVYATPPCQGMSSNGMGRLKWENFSGQTFGGR